MNNVKLLFNFDKEVVITMKHNNTLVAQARQQSNQCNICQISHMCLTARLDKTILSHMNQLQFKGHLLKPGQHLYWQGDQLNSLYLIRSGILKSYTILEDGREYIMGFHLPPDLFGWEGIVDGFPPRVSVVALDHSNICEIPLSTLERLVREIPQINAQLLRMVSKRVAAANQALLRCSAQQRVANFIVQLALQYRQLGYPEDVCNLMMTQQDIANYLRMTPETICRIIRRLVKDSILQVTRKKIFILDFKKLEEYAKPGH